MGYFDALTSSYFKTTPDGRKVFFPWGVLGRGYAIASDAEFERLRRQVRTYTVVSLILIIATVVLQGALPVLIVGALLLVFYAVWMQFVLPRLQPSEEKLSLRESMTTQARTHSRAGLWALEIGALAFVAIGIAMLVFDPENWLAGLASVLFFGLCAAVFTRMLMLRSRSGGA